MSASSASLQATRWIQDTSLLLPMYPVGHGKFSELKSSRMWSIEPVEPTSADTRDSPSRRMRSRGIDPLLSWARNWFCQKNLLYLSLSGERGRDGNYTAQSLGDGQLAGAIHLSLQLLQEGFVDVDSSSEAFHLTVLRYFPHTLAPPFAQLTQVRTFWRDPVFRRHSNN